MNLHEFIVCFFHMGFYIFFFEGGGGIMKNTISRDVCHAT